jgi:hypothetical protein
MHAGVDVYLFPAVVGGGLGDIEEVLAAGRQLERAGYRVLLYRTAGDPLPRSVDGPWDWPRVERLSSLRPRAGHALTITPSWGISAAPDREGPLGRGGPWQEEARAVERAYGIERTLHVSLEEFARTWTSRRETMERWREGGRPVRTIRVLARTQDFRREVARWREAYRRFRDFGRPNVAHLYATFRPHPGFSREFPEAVQCGPLWSRRSLGLKRPNARGQRSWVWYASPASAERLLPLVLEGLEGTRPIPFLWIRSPHAWRSVPPPQRGRIETTAEPPGTWRRRFAQADVRIVTGSRTLLEAIELGGPFLYFNGVLGRGRRQRRHRPDKVEALAQAAIELGVDRHLVRDLRDFASGRRVRETVYRAARSIGPWAHFPRGPWVSGFRSPYDDAGHLLLAMARALADGETATQLVERVRARALW